jgi:uncharacterized protein YecT (DUF1311 family)
MVLALCCIGQVALANDEPGYTSQYSVCLDKAAGVTADTLNCMGTEVKIQDASLNKAYKAVMAQLTPARRKSLQDAQRAWIKFRDANCSFYEDPEGGTNATLMGSDCYLTATANRAREIERFKE